MSNNNNKGLLDKKRQAKLADEWEKEGKSEFFEKEA